MPTKKQKIKIYTHILKSIKQNGPRFICPFLRRAISNPEMDGLAEYYLRDLSGYFPEFFAFKPTEEERNGELGWWPSWDAESRKKVLTKILFNLQNQ
jgi:hypothetical protein